MHFYVFETERSCTFNRCDDLMGLNDDESSQLKSALMRAGEIYKHPCPS